MITHNALESFYLDLDEYVHVWKKERERECWFDENQFFQKLRHFNRQSDHF